MKNIRVRFAPSPTGALHIGGIRTALYNYLLARKTGGTFILRIEDTDQLRYVPGAEAYILEALSWCGLRPDEGPLQGGDYGPYRQSERKAIYADYALRLVAGGWGYYAFDTAEALDEQRAADPNFKYDAAVRDRLDNSLHMSPEELNQRLASGEPYTIRLKVPPQEVVEIEDIVRGQVTFSTNELDDKVMLKADGMPTYHLANVVDDYLMKITHVIRGEEWLPSTAHHKLLYQAFGWEAHMPAFAHLPLILKPSGQGKLSKRDGAKFGFPVFPIGWQGDTAEDSFQGFREFGFDPAAMINFLAFLGWNPGTEQEIFSLEQLAQAFSLEKIGKGGARFDYDKARWFNQQYIMASPDEQLAAAIRPFIEAHGHQPDDDFLLRFTRLMKERMATYAESYTNGRFCFEAVENYDEKTIAKKWHAGSEALFTELRALLMQLPAYQAQPIQACVEGFMQEKGLKTGDVLPVLRIALTGSMQGPAVFELMELLGEKEVDQRFAQAFRLFVNFVATNK